MIRFRVLGPIEADSDGAPIPLGGPKQRAVLAMLLLDANQVVPVPRLVAGVWGERAGDRTTHTLQVYVSNLRRLLGSDLLLTRPPGYLLLATDETLDLIAFRAVAAEGRRALEEDRLAEAAELLGRAQRMWRGPAVADLTGEPFALAELAALDETRLATMEARIEADLARGSAADVIAELRVLTAEQPLRERLHGLLVEGLHRCGRQADALAAFDTARRILADELGIAPGAPLRRLHAAVLAQQELGRVHDRGRPYLLFHDGAGQQQVIALDVAAAPLTIGRRSSNVICLGWDLDVSREHARLEHVDGGWELVDDGASRNGTFVDGERVQGRRRLRDAEAVRIGGTVLLYRSAEPAVPPPVRHSGVTRERGAPVVPDLSDDDLALLRGLDVLGSRYAGSPQGRAALARRLRRSEAGIDAALTVLRGRFDTCDDELLLARARAIGLLGR